jgi:hypothetical protein
MAPKSGPITAEGLIRVPANEASWDDLNRELAAEPSPQGTAVQVARNARTGDRCPSRTPSARSRQIWRGVPSLVGILVSLLCPGASRVRCPCSRAGTGRVLRPGGERSGQTAARSTAGGGSDPLHHAPGGTSATNPRGRGRAGTRLGVVRGARDPRRRGRSISGARPAGPFDRGSCGGCDGTSVALRQQRICCLMDDEHSDAHPE